MKSTLIYTLLIVALGITYPAFSQDRDSQKPNIYKTRVSPIGHPYKIALSGYLLFAEEDSLTLMMDLSTMEKQTIAIQGIHTLRIKKKGKFGTSLFTGMVIGAGTGALIGFLDGDDQGGFLAFSASQKAAIGAFLGGLTGTVIGGLVGLTSIKITLNGNKKTYAAQRARLKQYELRF